MPRILLLSAKQRKEFTKTSREIFMGSTSDKIKGMANEASGNVKQAAGKATGNKKLAAKGFAQERKGEAQQAVGKAKDTVKKMVDKA